MQYFEVLACDAAMHKGKYDCWSSGFIFSEDYKDNILMAAFKIGLSEFPAV